MTIAFENDIERQLRAISPRAELERLEKLRAVLAAAEAGWSQRDIARRVGVEQPEISRLLKKARLRPDVRERTPREVLLRYAVGELTHEQMMTELEHWDYTFGGTPADDPAADVYVRGTWDQIERAGDLLSDEDYQRLFDATASQRAASRRE
ncbi:MAG: hypothetical protein GXY65_14850 [Rhodococcus sp.]|uniref:helix-turn-helix domain-containing protein n=1 Tax=Rhodococcus TaxID=1827 RepID=UPI00169237D4|nr:MULTISPECIES: helix-turn-helix domain-containing protein [Rhodococcus]NLV80583.1 hypothetical protein [Rhodococcus sp. (in: high G+C Gram-positive bacteria)]